MYFKCGSVMYLCFSYHVYTIFVCLLSMKIIVKVMDMIN